MCGIAGFCLNPKHQSKVNQSELTSQMLLDIEHRGYHATGVAWINPSTGKRAVKLLIQFELKLRCLEISCRSSTMK